MDHDERHRARAHSRHKTGTCPRSAVITVAGQDIAPMPAPRDLARREGESGSGYFAG